MIPLEKQINECILSQKKWADLNNRMRDLIGSSPDYDRKIFKYSVENQLRYRGNLVRFVLLNEYNYYEELLKYSRNHLMLFPYHLSDYIISAMRITPFQYYISILTHIIEQEKSYDTLPNFTAADCLRLLSIGRNQYIDIMNQSRSTYKKFFGIGVKRNIRHLLPRKPNEDINIEPWWFINAGYITEEDVKTMVNQNERNVIDKLVSADGISNQILAMTIDERYVRSLYLKGLIYLDVPVYDDDLIVVPPLEGFVMNRITGDYLETLLYKIFVSIDQNTPVLDLAKILDIDIRLIKNAVSMYCRLGFAYKRNLYIDPIRCHSSWKKKLDEYQRLGVNIIKETSMQPPYLIQSNKELSDLMSKLVSSDQNNILESSDDCLSSPTELCLVKGASNCDFQRPQSKSDNGSLTSSMTLSQMPTQINVAKRIVLIYDANLAAFLMMGNMSAQLKNHAVTMFEVGKLPEESIESLTYELSKVKKDSLEDDGYEASRYYTHATMLLQTIEFIRNNERLACHIYEQYENQPKIGLDLVRVESLSNLDAKSCQRLIKKNYIFAISTAPLSQEVRLDALTGLPNLGPGSPLINSLWLRLFIYHMTGFGPPSMLLVRGHRLMYLPALFLNYEYLLVTPWGRESTCIPSKSALLTINESASHFPILFQAYNKDYVSETTLTTEEKVYIPLPLLKNETTPILRRIENEQPIVKLKQVIDLTRCCGYLTMIKPTSLLIEKEESYSKEESTFKEESTNPIDVPSSDLEKECDRNKQEPKQALAQTIISSEPCLEDLRVEDIFTEHQLFDCTFGVPLLQEDLNKQIRHRIVENGLCRPESLNQLVKFTADLHERLSQFVSEFTLMPTDKSSVTTVDKGDQRHFFYFPDNEQFACPVPRPTRSLIFHNGALKTFNQDSEG